MKAAAVKGSTMGEIEIQLDQLMGNGFKPTLGIAFNSIDLPIEPTAALFESRKIPFIGNSSGGEIINGELGGPSVVILLLDIEPANFRVLWGEAGNKNIREVARDVAKEAHSAFSKPAFLVVGSGMTTDGEMIVKGIKDELGPEVTIFGGTASEYLRGAGTFTFVSGHKMDDGLVAIAFDEEKISIDGLAVGGWEPVGFMRTITRSTGNIAYEFDNQPALDVLLRYLGKVDLDISEHSARESMWSSNFQVMIHRDEGLPVVRTPMLFNQQDRSIVFAATVPQGSRFQFSLLPSFEVIENVITEFKKKKEESPEADALVLFSCKGREFAFGPWIEEEIQNIAKLWDAPMAGFLCFGEIGKTRNARSEFNNLTCSLVILKEK